MFSTRSVGMNLARPFKAGKHQKKCPRRVATFDLLQIQSSLRDEDGLQTNPGVETPG